MFQYFSGWRYIPLYNARERYMVVYHIIILQEL